MWGSSEERLRMLEERLNDRRAVVLRGGDYDRWDLEVRDGTFGAIRLQIVVEEHGGGKQMIKCRAWPIVSVKKFLIIFGVACLTIAAALDGATGAATILGFVCALLTFFTYRDCGSAASIVRSVLKDFGYKGS